MATRCRWVVGLLLMAGTGLGQVARCQLSTEEAWAGETVAYDVAISNLGEAEILEPPAVEGLTFQLVSAGPRGERVLSINGRVSRSVDWGARWEVVAATAGDYSIRVPKISAGGQTVAGNAVTLRVRDPKSQDLLRITSSGETRVVLGEMVTLTVDVLLKHLPAPAPDPDPLHFHDQGFPRQMVPPVVSVPWFPEPPFGRARFDVETWLRSVLSRGKGLRVGRFSQRFVGEVSDVDAADLQGNPARYRRYRFQVELRADAIGKFDLGRAQVEGDVAELVDGRFRQRRVFAIADPLTVVVEEAPVAGRPASYGGAVGRFAFEVSPPTPAAVALGSPVYLTARITGEGALDGVRLDLESQLGDGWRVDPPTISDSPAPGEPRPDTVPPGMWRQFDFRIRPLRKDISEVPPIRFAYFDPKDRKYVERASPAHPLQILADGSASADGVLDATGGARRGATELVAVGLASNVDDLNLLDDQRSRPSTYLAYAGVLVPAWCVGLLWLRRRRRDSEDPAAVRRRGAASRAKGRLSAAKSLLPGHPDQALMGVVAALRGFVADRGDRAEEALTTGDLSHWAQRAGWDPAALDGLRRMMDAAEAQSFGGGAPKVSDVEDWARLVGSALLDRGRSNGSLTGWVVITTGLAIFGPKVSAQDVDTFVRARQAFEAGAFSEAAALFESMVTDDYANGYVLYDAGNAWLLAGEIGRALSAFRRAQWYLPRDVNLARNLDIALERRRQSLSSSEPGLGERLFFWRSALTFGGQATLAALGLSLAAVASWLRYGSGRNDGWLRVLLVVGLLVGIGCGATATLTCIDQRSQTHGAIIADDVPLRQWPAEDAELAYENPLFDGDEFRVVARRGAWLRVRVADTYEGWVPEERVTTW